MMEQYGGKNYEHISDSDIRHICTCLSFFFLNIFIEV